jgi:microtubule-associated protein, RP/EB family
MGESRTELLQWLNELLAINYTKIEQCGTGAAYCQIFDSIYGLYSAEPPSRLWLILACLRHFAGDLPMSRVKFAAKHEYESLANFKILQNVFKTKKIEKVSQLSRLIILCTVFSCCMYPAAVDLNPLTH